MAYLMLLHPKQSNRYREAIIKEEILTLMARFTKRSGKTLS